MGMTVKGMRNCLELMGWHVERVLNVGNSVVWKLTKNQEVT